MKLLVTTAHPSLAHHRDPDTGAIHRNLGRLVQPRHCSSIERTAADGLPWAADNDCFQGLDALRFYAMLDRLTALPGCLFVTVPDVVRCLACGRTVDGYRDGRACGCARETSRRVAGDALLTARRFEAWAPGLERRGLPVALVLQDSLEHPRLACGLAVTWHRLDAVFVGGSTTWKLGPAAAVLVRLALRDGKHVHWSRVNTRARLRCITASAATRSTARASPSGATRTWTPGSPGRSSHRPPRGSTPTGSCSCPPESTDARARPAGHRHRA